MVSIASELLPLPLGPQKTVMESRGISTLTDFRLCSDADSTVICWFVEAEAEVEEVSRAGLLKVLFVLIPRDLAMAAAVKLFVDLATVLGGPFAITSPPPSPPSGPRSMIQSAARMTSRLCSTMTRVFPLSANRCITFRSNSISAKCKPVVGSSNT